MAQINKSSEYFNTVLWTGNATDNRSITGVNFKPDLVWYKERSSTSWHNLQDVVRGTGKQIHSNSTDSETTNNGTIKAFETDGFQIGTEADINESGQTYVAWNWLASNTTASNTAGSITSTVSANTTSGFSIVTYTTSSSGTDTIGHGLGVKPDVLITKSRDNTYNWDILHKSINDDGVGRMTFTTNGYLTGSNPYASTTPTSSVFSFSADFYGASNNVTYCFAEKKGFSKFGKYIGNGSSDGTFVYTGFKPAFILIKCTSTTTNWLMRDNKRDPFNESITPLSPNLNLGESSFTPSINEVDILSNGFKLRDTYVDQNQSGSTYIYMAFAENPLVGTNNIPATAR